MRPVLFVLAIIGAVGLSGLPGGVPAARAQIEAPAKPGAAGKVSSKTPGEASAETVVDLPAKSLRGVKLRNMPAGARVAARIVTDGDIRIFVVDAAAFNNRTLAHDALFAGRVRDALAFAFVIPKRSNYFLVLDNRAGAGARKVRVSLKARAGGPSLSGDLERVSRELAALFIDTPPAISAVRCGTKTAVRVGASVELCLEYVEALMRAIPDRGQVGSLVLFTVVRAAGGELLARWDDPGAGDDARLNEFAATLMVMLNQRRRFDRTLALVAKDGAALAGVERVYRADSHPGIADDAARLRALLADGRRLARWRDVLVRRLRTRVLERLVSEAPKGKNLSVVRAEIERRKRAN